MSATSSIATSVGRASLGALFRLAIAAGVPKAVEIQLRRGAPLDGRDVSGRSPLMLAAERGHVDLCRLLLSHGADLRLTDDRGRDAVWFARSRGHDIVATLLARAAPEVSNTADQAGPTGPAAAEASEAKDKNVAVPPDPPATRREERPTEDGGWPVPDNPAPPPPSIPSAAPEAPQTRDPACADPDVSGPDLPRDGLDAVSLPLAAVPSAIPSQGTGSTAWNDAWEPEDDPVLSATDSTLEAAASAIQSRLAIHEAIVDDADWTDVEVEFHVPGGLWTLGFREDFDPAQRLRDILDSGLVEGRVPARSIEDFLSSTPSGEPDEHVERALVAVLDALGIAVDDDEPDRPLLHPPAVGGGRAEHDRLIFREVMEFLDDSVAEFGSDLGLLDAVLRRSRPPSSAEDETGIFLALHDVADRLMLVASRHPAAGEVLADWLRRCESRKMSGADFFRKWDEGTFGEQEDEVGTPADAAAILTQMFAQGTARSTGTQVPPLPRGIATPRLLPERIVELAERVCGQTPSGHAADDEVRRVLNLYLASRDRVVAMNLRMVAWQSRRCLSKNIPLADLVQEGVIGLMRAVERFDPTAGVRFGTYAIWWIRQQMMRSIADKERTIRLPVHVQDKLSRLARVHDQLTLVLHRQPDLPELSAAMGEAITSVRRLREIITEIVPLDPLLDDEPDDLFPGGVADAGLVDAQASPLDLVLHSDLRKCLDAGLGQLDTRQRRVLVLRYGLEDGNPLTLEDVGRMYGVTRERIRQIEAKALGRIRRFLPSKRFEAIQP